MNVRYASFWMQRRPQAPGILLLLACSLFSLLQASFAQQASSTSVDPEAAKNYAVLAHGVTEARLQSTISDLSGIHYAVPASVDGPSLAAYSRVAGTPGGDISRRYVQSQFQQIFGAQNVSAEPFNVTAPADQGASVTAGGRSYVLQPLWPNLVRTSTLPVAGVDGPLIYAGRGDLRAFRGQTVEGSIVLMDFNCGTQWLNASRLGAKAIIFIEPSQTMRGEGEAKFVGIPVAIPRFWMSRGGCRAAAVCGADHAEFHGTSCLQQPLGIRAGL